MDAAVAFADARGLPELTLQALGAAMGVSTTAMYRYFADKDDLIVAMREALLSEALASVDIASEPRDLILAAGRGFRATAREHPCLGQLMVQSALRGDNAALVPVVITRALTDLGLQGLALVQAYRQLETLVVGASVFDFSGAPTHLEDRLARLRQMGDPTVDAILTDTDAIQEVNERAFDTTLVLVVDTLIAQARADR